MSLKPVHPGLRPVALRTIKHDAVSASKVSLSIPAGDELVVSDVVADQLVAASRQFKDVDDCDDAEVVEQATDAPGERRSVKRPARKSAAKPKG